MREILPFDVEALRIYEAILKTVRRELQGNMQYVQDSELVYPLGYLLRKVRDMSKTIEVR